ncbi:putative phospholipid metabolism-related protein [Dioszegia hungarica]|uniref:Phospholipid metabolism-related protein n=1 Tax=Dioszegia hungarica TaxID=4972 RepID=A0AA38HCW9_9TREE|nr:putative phospholipid metabolism-related protein [Dioszegia hungarica]KAI9636581.1 putative phospholipid metabolism-related protein [Dioszegia hungarica]
MAYTLPGTGESACAANPVRARRWRIFWSYLPDWCLTILFWVTKLIDKVDGNRRLFSVTDESLAHPYANPERVPVWLLGVICGLVPALFMILTAAFIRRSFWDAHSAILGFVLNLGLTVTFTNVVKITVGRPRPDFFARCQIPDSITSNPIHGLTSWTVCQNLVNIKEGFRSFPSGHSSFAWAGMWYLILYAAAKMRINNRRGHTWKAWLLLAPLLCSTLVSISRTMDYRHHATDVIAGGIVGIATSWFSYRQYYPPVCSPQSYKPYSPRIPHPDAEKSSLPLHNKPRRSSSENLTSAYGSGTGGAGVEHAGYKNPYDGYPPRREEESVMVHEGQREEEERLGMRSEDVETVQR